MQAAQPSQDRCHAKHTQLPAAAEEGQGKRNALLPSVPLPPGRSIVCLMAVDFHNSAGDSIHACTGRVVACLRLPANAITELPSAPLPCQHLHMPACLREARQQQQSAAARRSSVKAAM